MSKRSFVISTGTLTAPAVESATGLSESFLGTSLLDIATTTTLSIPTSAEVISLCFIYILLGVAGAAGAGIFTYIITPALRRAITKLRNASKSIKTSKPSEPGKAISRNCPSPNPSTNPKPQQHES